MQHSPLPTSHLLSQAALALFLLHHVVAAHLAPALAPISLCWGPLCVLQIASRHSLSKLSDPALGYRLDSERMTLVLLAGCAMQAPLADTFPDTLGDTSGPPLVPPPHNPWTPPPPGRLL